MEYKISELAEMYTFYLGNMNIEIEKPKSQDFDLNAYNDYTYLDCIKDIDRAFNSCDDYQVTLDFLQFS